MKRKNNLLFPVAVVLSLISSAAIADAALTEHQHIGASHKISQSVALEKMIQKNTEQKLAAEANRYTRIAELAGDRRDELVKKQSEVENAYKMWQSSKSSVEQSHNATLDDFKAIEATAQSYSQAHKAFIDFQKDILAKNGASSDLVVSFNAAPPTAAGSK